MISHMLKPNIKRQKTFSDIFKRFHSINATEAGHERNALQWKKVLKYIKIVFIQVKNQ